MTSTELQGIAHELKFWKKFVQTPHFLNEWASKKHCIELTEGQKEVYDIFLQHPDARVLDVGAGAVSILNGIVKDELLEATDPLGPLYQIVFDYKKYGLKPPHCLPAEDISSCFDQEFDIVHMRNALDHCQDPNLVYGNLYRAVKPGGYLIIHGFENEAHFENWEGFHQWNIYIDNGKLHIDGKESRSAVEPDEVILAKKLILETGKHWFIWIEQKKS